MVRLFYINCKLVRYSEEINGGGFFNLLGEANLYWANPAELRAPPEAQIRNQCVVTL